MICTTLRVNCTLADDTTVRSACFGAANQIEFAPLSHTFARKCEYYSSLVYLIGMRSRRTKCCQHRRVGAPRTWRLRSSSTAVSSSLRAVPRPLPRVVAGTPRFARRPRCSVALCFAQGTLSLFSLRRALLRRSAPSVPSFRGRRPRRPCGFGLLCAAHSAPRGSPLPPLFAALPLRSGGSLGRGAFRAFPPSFAGCRPPRKNSLRSSAGW